MDSDDSSGKRKSSEFTLNHKKGPKPNSQFTKAKSTKNSDPVSCTKSVIYIGVYTRICANKINKKMKERRGILVD